VADANWERIDGGAAGRGVDPLRLRFDRFLNFVWTWAIERVEDPERWTANMTMPPPSMGPQDAPRRRPSEAEQQVEGESFESFFGAYQRGIG
jgi:hypothetical protein